MEELFTKWIVKWRIARLHLKGKKWLTEQDYIDHWYIWRKLWRMHGSWRISIFQKSLKLVLIMVLPLALNIKGYLLLGILPKSIV
jgi:hypothetical protein